MLSLAEIPPAYRLTINGVEISINDATKLTNIILPLSLEIILLKQCTELIRSKTSNICSWLAYIRELNPLFSTPGDPS